MSYRNGPFPFPDQVGELSQVVSLLDGVLQTVSAWRFRQESVSVEVFGILLQENGRSGRPTDLYPNPNDFGKSVRALRKSAHDRG